MSLARKIFYYLIGVTMGIFIVIFLFGGRNLQCSYFPNDRVLYDLRGKERVFPADVKVKMLRNNIDTADISNMLLTGDVDFSRSHTHGDTCKTYWVDSGSETSRAFSAEFRNCDSTVTVLRVVNKP